ncbi:hypothetical protein, partial [Marichromatium bheemlicum]|uniref:hypothetical protein n=1 Tax=Marichromatium bheemlicum TaxID=365339 RepID=UPI001B2FF38D
MNRRGKAGTDIAATFTNADSVDYTPRDGSERPAASGQDVEPQSRKVRKGARKQLVISGLHALWLLEHGHSAILACRAAGEARRKKFTFVFF